MKIVVEDEKEILEFLRKSLEAECYVVDTAEDGEKGSFMARTNEYDLIILDNTMPKKIGQEVCKDVRKDGKNVPILILSVRSETTTKVDLLNAGADDYLTKPFSLDELLARIKALTRRPAKIEDEVLQVEDLVLDAGRHLVKREGEKYRNKLKKIIIKHKLQNNVKFYNKYLSEKEVIDFLRATDIFIYPMLSREQASSGSLSDAMSCGCPAIATRSQYAESVLNNERGRLVRFRNSKDIKNALLELIPNKPLRKEMKKNTYFYTRYMTWQNVALSYFKLFNASAKIVPREKDKLPVLKLDYIKKLTDNFGMIQFANHTKPAPHSGYCLDDNARALLGCAKAYELKKTKGALDLVEKYLKFIKFTQKNNGKFYNFVNYQRAYNDKGESEDSFGRAVWSLGYLISQEIIPVHIRKTALTMLKKTLTWMPGLHSIRAVAFSIIGLSYILGKDDSDIVKPKQSQEIMILLKKLSDKLVKQFNKQLNNQANEKWLWFEDCFTYSNYKLPESLFRAYKITKNKNYLTIAEKSIKFLAGITYETKEFFSPIGQDGWYFRNGQRAYFDQQPEDAASAVEAFVFAHQVTKKKNYATKAKLAFHWFLGKNHLNQMVYDEATGGCYDGLGKYSLNFNQGAESSISYFLARLAIEQIPQKTNIK